MFTLMERRISKLAKKGVKFMNSSNLSNFYVEKDVEIGKGSVIYPGTYLYSGTSIGENCTIYPGANIFESSIGDGVTIWPNVSMYRANINSFSTIHSHNRIARSSIGMRSVVDSYSKIIDSNAGFSCRIGPHAHIRDGSVLANHSEVANIEIVRSHIGPNTKAKHGTYIGDAEIGRNCNIGAGTVFCNYDGSQKNKTVLEDDVFVGSGSMLIAPLTLGKESFIAAGSVVARNVPPGTLVIDRGQPHSHHQLMSEIQKNGGAVHKAGYVTKYEDGWYLGRKEK